MSTPVVPPRSALRTTPQTKTPVTPPSVRERHSSLYLLPADSPLQPTESNTPSLSSGSGSDLDVDAATHRRQQERLSACKLPKDTKKRMTVGTEKDPNRIRDGREPTESSSGVYTRTSFFYTIADRKLTPSQHLPRCTRPSTISLPLARLHTDKFPTLPQLGRSISLCLILLVN